MSSGARRETRRPRRLAVVCDQLNLGGQEIGMLDLLARLDRRRFAPHVYAFRRGPLLASLLALGIPVTARHRTPGARWTPADTRAKVRFRRELAHMLRRDGIDVCLVYAWADAVAAAREAGVPAIVERVDGPKLAGWVRDKSSCQRVICESRAIARLLTAQRALLRCAPSRIVVVPNGIDRARFDPDRYDRDRCRRALGVKVDDFVVGTIARLAPVKNLGHVLEAARLLINRLDGSVSPRFLIVGPDDGEGAALKQQARRLGIADRVRFVGPRSDTASVLRALDVFVLPSIQEGLPFALLEAMSMGLPVIASQADSIVEVVRDNGYLVSPVDPFRTTVALLDLARQPALRRTLGERSRRLASQYDVAPMVRRYEHAMEAAFNDGRRRDRPTRRIAILPADVDTALPQHGTAGSASASEPLRDLFTLLRRQRADVYWLGFRAHGAGDGAEKVSVSWPMPRRQWFARTDAGWLGRRVCTEWLRPDLVITDCPSAALSARRWLPGEEIVLVPDVAGDRRAVSAVTLAQVDRLVGMTAADRLHIRTRWPRWSWKISEPLAMLNSSRPERAPRRP